MKLSTITVALGLTLTAASSFASTQNHFMAVIDAGSSGSRMHIFEYQTPAAGQRAHVTEITDGGKFPEKIKPGISSYATTPTQAGPSLQKILIDAKTELATSGATGNVPLYVYSTAGMRVLPTNQRNAINTDINQYIKKNDPFFTANAETIPGGDEGFYDWLSLNTMANTLDQNTHDGILDMGGASTEITFNSNDQGVKTCAISVGSHTYHVFSKSFLKLGQNESMAIVSNEPKAVACYPTGYHYTNSSGSHIGKFNFAQCSKLINNYIDTFHIPETVPLTAVAHHHFYAFSGYYYDLSFYKVQMNNTALFGLARLIPRVGSLGWTNMQRYYTPSSYLSGELFMGTFAKNILSHGYDFAAFGQNLTIANKLNHVPIDWPLGVVVYDANKATGLNHCGWK